MSAKANLLKYLEIKNEKKPDFYRKTGLSNGFLDKNEHISSKNLEIIISIYTDLNLYTTHNTWDRQNMEHHAEQT